MYRLLILTLCTQFTFGLAAQTTYQSNWQGRPDMTWTGPELWANRLQDWQIREGSLECNISGANRSVALMTHTVKPGVGFEMVVEAQWLNRTPTPGIMGFRFGVKGKVDDYRSAAIYGKGINAGINKKGHLIIGESESPEQIDPLMLQHVIRLHLHAQPDNKIGRAHV